MSTETARVTITYRRAYNVRIEQTYTASAPADLVEEANWQLDEWVCSHGQLVSEGTAFLDDDDLEGLVEIVHATPATKQA